MFRRIDYGRPRGALRTAASEDKARKNKKRPPAKLFDPEKIRSIGGEISNDGDFMMFEGGRYSRWEIKTKLNQYSQPVSTY